MVLCCELNNVGLKLSHFAQSQDTSARLDPYEWPLLAISADRGSPGVCGLQFLQRVELLNVDETWDMNHSAWDDEKNTIGDMGDRGWMLLMLMTVNVMSGPWRSDARYQLSCSALQRLWEERRPHEVPLFIASAGNIADELDIPRNDPDLLEQCWRSMLCSGPLGRKGYICNLNRFYGFVEVGLDELVRRRCWHQMAFITLYVSLESDFLAGAKVKQFRARSSAAREAEATGGSSTDARRPGAEDQGIRAAAGNAYSLAALMRSDEYNMWKWRIITLAGEATKRWQGIMNSKLRGVSETGPWLRAQMKGDFMNTMSTVVAAICQEGRLVEIGFTMPTSDPLVGFPDGDMHMQDSMASYFARYCLHLVGNRIKRELWLLRGWPSRSQLFLDGEDQALRGLACLRSDWERYKALETYHAETLCTTAAEFLARSVFALVPVQQLIGIAQKEDWVCTPKFQEWLRVRGQRILQTQLAEDAFNREKCAARASSTTRNGREHLAYHTLIQSDLLKKVHHYDSVVADGGLVSERGLCLTPSAFRPLYKNMSVQCRGLVGYNQKTAWHSSAANRLMRPHSDLSTLEEAARAEQWHALPNLWMACLMAIEHNIVVRRRQGEDTWGPWLLPLKEIPDSSCVFWTVQEFSKEEVGVWYQPARVSDAQPILSPVFDVSEWQARRIEWLSPMGQAAKMGLTRLVTGAGFGIRARAMGEVDTLLRISARQAFWKLPLPMIEKWCKSLHVEFLPGSGLFDTLWQVVKHILSTTDEETLTILQGRLDKSHHSDSNVYDDLIEMDETMVALDPSDQQDLIAEQSKGKAASANCQEFVSAFVRKRNVVRPRPAEPARPRKGGGRKIKGALAGGGGALHLPEGDLLHCDLKPLCPAGGGSCGEQTNRVRGRAITHHSHAWARVGACMDTDGRRFWFLEICGRSTC